MTNEFKEQYIEARDNFLSCDQDAFQKDEKLYRDIIEYISKSAWFHVRFHSSYELLEDFISEMGKEWFESELFLKDEYVKFRTFHDPFENGKISSVIGQNYHVNPSVKRLILQGDYFKIPKFPYYTQYEFFNFTFRFLYYRALANLNKEHIPHDSLSDIENITDINAKSPEEIFFEELTEDHNFIIYDTIANNYPILAAEYIDEAISRRGKHSMVADKRDIYLRALICSFHDDKNTLYGICDDFGLLSEYPAIRRIKIKIGENLMIKYRIKMENYYE